MTSVFSGVSFGKYPFFESMKRIREWQISAYTKNFTDSLQMSSAQRVCMMDKKINKCIHSDSKTESESASST